ncbi:KIF-binding protein isoform X2 [Nomia melanderi]|nr:KIF-binding protein isoform X2 [Nomia melanderi]XP_031848098.1 KIF-binding protein isoform X2 [Nomia melanderi]XP_031848099.1 KIF-binding protein isoform X2 [Nomia melanderi]
MKNKCTIQLALTHLRLSTLYVDEEDLKAGEEQLEKCIDLLKDKEMETDAITPLITALNQQGFILSQWKQPLKAKVVLHRAEQIFQNYTKDNKEYKIPRADFNTIQEVHDEVVLKEVFEKLHTMTLFYLAQIYTSLQDHYMSAIYCHMTLRRQLYHNEVMHDLDHIDWALNAATLSQYFLEIEGFTQARYHLGAASYILQVYEDKLKKKTEVNGQTEAVAADWENFKDKSADVARCWAKYGLILLISSKERLLELSEEDEENDQANKKENSKPKLKEDLKFEVLEGKIEPIINQITDKYLLDFDDARRVFLNVQKWLDQAMSYYTFDDHASDYVHIVQDLSQAYNYLSFYEESEDRKAKMHKRRVDILENVEKELNPQFYKAACRQIWFELGETYSGILQIKFDRLNTTNKNPQAVMKINNLAQNSIKYFQKFIDSLETNSSDPENPKYSDDVLRPALFSYFQIGRMYSKMIPPDFVDNIANSIKAYKFVVDYCDKYPAAAEVMKFELNHCKELVSLLTILYENKKKIKNC